MDDFSGIEIDLDNPNQNQTAKQWFTQIFDNNHYMQT